MLAFPITSAKEGMNRQRNKGGAKPDSFWTLKNCYVTASRSVVPRPGSVGDEKLPENITKGLMAFRGKLYVFSSQPVTLTNPLYESITLRHPDPSSTAVIQEIHFAQPFLGFPYVVAEFSDDPTTFYHFWLQEQGTWEANHVYMESEVILPTVDNGYAYMATRLNPASDVWAPLVARTIGDKIEPTVGNGYEFTVIATDGANPASGTVEPAWNAADGAITYEDSNTGPPPASNPPPTPPPGGGDGNPTSDRYGPTRPRTTTAAF